MKTNTSRVFYSVISLLFLIFNISCFSGRFYGIYSPDGSIELLVDNYNGMMTYSVKKNNKVIIDSSVLGLKTDEFDFVDNLEAISWESSTNDESWTQVLGEQEVIRDYYDELLVKLQTSDTKLNFNIRFRVFNDGVGFRYEIPIQKGIENFNILDELTEFNFSEDSKSWWIPAYAYRRYEFLYANTLISEISRDKFSELVENLNGPRLGPEAVQTPFTVQRDDGIAIAVHEANLTNYSSMTLKATGTKNLECDLIPWSDGIKVRTSAPLDTPWRTIIIGETAADLPLSTLMLNLNEPNKLKDVSWINPGKYIGLWWEMIGTNQSTWGSGPHHGAKTKRVMEYLDFGAKYGFDGVLVEGWNTGWDENWCCTGEGESFGFYEPHPEFDDERIAEYAKKKGIRLVGHHETGTQIDNYEEQLENAFAYCKRNGIRVVKTGYVNDGSQNIKRVDENGDIQKEWHHGQYMVEHFRKVLEVAAKYEVSIVVHEPIKDTGIRRTYPNMISREGARGQEFNGFMPIDVHNKPDHTTILPFTRLINAPMDYTPGIFNIKEYRYNSPDDRTINTNHHIPSTIAKELAHYVVIYAPVQMAADLPENYEGHPAFNFILDVPTDWKQTKVLNGEIGKYITTVRQDRESEDWYLGSITNEDSRTLTIEMSFLDEEKEYEATIYKDPEDGGWKTKPEEVLINSMVFKNGDKYDIVLPPGGGQAIKFSPKG